MDVGRSMDHFSFMQQDPAASTIKVEDIDQDSSMEFNTIADVFTRFSDQLSDNSSQTKSRQDSGHDGADFMTMSGGSLGGGNDGDTESWDSGVILDTNTVVQMAEFQEVVNNLQKELLAPPPYPGNHTSPYNGNQSPYDGNHSPYSGNHSPYPGNNSTTNSSATASNSALPTLKVTFSDASQQAHDRMLDQLLYSTPSLLNTNNNPSLLNTQNFLVNRNAVSYNGSGNAVMLGGSSSAAQPRSLPVTVDLVPNIVERVRSDTLTSRPPTFKQSRATSRTNMKQLLDREQCMEQQQKAAERQEELRRTSAAMLPASTPGVNIPHQHTEIPTSVFKIETRLENPTKYHVIESQRRQVAEYLTSTPTGAQLASTPTGQTTCLQLSPMSSNTDSMQQGHNISPGRVQSTNDLLSPIGGGQTANSGPFLSVGGQGTSSVLSPSNSTNVSRRASSSSYLSPPPTASTASSAPHTPNGGGCVENRRASGGGGGPFSPSCSSATTSPSEYTPSEVGNCEDFLDEILTQGDSLLDNNLLEFKDKIGDLVKEEPLGEDDMKAMQRDRIKKDNHNMIERRRRFNINDRIKELGHLLPKQSEQYYELVRDVRHNKGSILKASVDYIKILKKEKERKLLLEEEMRRTKYQNKKLIQKLQEYEEMMSKVEIAEPPKQRRKSQVNGDDEIYMEH